MVESKSGHMKRNRWGWSGYVGISNRPFAIYEIGSKSMQGRKIVRTYLFSFFSILLITTGMGADFHSQWIPSDIAKVDSFSYSKNPGNALFLLVRFSQSTFFRQCGANRWRLTGSFPRSGIRELQFNRMAWEAIGGLHGSGNRFHFARLLGGRG